MRRLALAFAATLGACAHASHGLESRRAFFTCDGLRVDEAAANLTAGGFALAERAPGAPARTGWTEMEITQDGVTQQLTVRLEVRSSTDAVDFSIIEASAAGETTWDEVTERQVASEPSRTLLNRLRKAVCGSPDPYFAEP